MDGATEAAQRAEDDRTRALDIRRPLTISGDIAVDRLQLGRDRARWRNGQALHRLVMAHDRAAQHRADPRPRCRRPCCRSAPSETSAGSPGP